MESESVNSRIDIGRVFRTAGSWVGGLPALLLFSSALSWALACSAVVPLLMSYKWAVMDVDMVCARQF